MEFVIALAMKFWQWTVLIAVVNVRLLILLTRVKTKQLFHTENYSIYNPA